VSQWTLVKNAFAQGQCTVGREKEKDKSKNKTMQKQGKTRQVKTKTGDENATNAGE